MNDETKCVYCGDPSAHPGTRKCSDSTACDLRMAYQDVRTLRARVAELEAMLGARHRIATAECERAGDVVEALPLDATPLADELRTLRALVADMESIDEALRREGTTLAAALERANEGVRYWTDLAQAEARDAAALRARVAELEAQVADLEGAVNR